MRGGRGGQAGQRGYDRRRVSRRILQQLIEFDQGWNHMIHLDSETSDHRVSNT